MSRLIVLYNYNKYYNRIIKRKSSFQDYLNLITPQGNTPAAYRGFIREKMNFDYQDGVYAQHIINFKKSELSLSLDHPDYCVLEESWTTGEGEQAVTETRITRYFILDVTKVRGYQYQLSLRRDLLADYYDSLMGDSSTTFLEKGWLKSADDSAIFNNESMTYNQIKKDELLLNNTKYSGKNNGWIVGYIAKEQQKQAIGPCTGIAEPPDHFLDFNDLPLKLKNLIDSGDPMVEYDRLYNFSFYLRRLSSQTYRSGIMMRDYNYGGYWSYNYEEVTFGGALLETTTEPSKQTTIEDFERVYQNNYHDFEDKLIEIMFNQHPEYFTSASQIRETYNGIIFQRNSKLYSLEFRRRPGNNIQFTKSYTPAQLGSGVDALAVEIASYFNDCLGINYVAINPDHNSSQTTIFCSAICYQYDVIISEVSYNELKCTIPSTRNENYDAPYDMFLIPNGAIDVYNSGSVSLSVVSNIASPMARGIAITGTTDKVYDIQILPYCPFDEFLTSDGDIDITGLTEGKDFSYIKQVVGGAESNVGIILYAKKCKGSFDIELNNFTGYFSYLKPITNSILNKKVASETRFVRFVSPNFASQFDINPQKNNGITRLNVDYFYKPYSPYLHIAPYFSGMYGNDFNDPKGLICSGDFSIATSSSQWEKYQIENKNYELTFNRQIQNLDINNSIAYGIAEKTANINVATSALTGLAAGAVSGGMIGSAAGPVGTLVGAAAGAVVGGVGGAITSAIGRKYDLEYLRQQQAEARSFATDMYAYSLGNVQALPYTLTKVSAFTPNNKIFPFIEIYDCTSEENAALQNKLKFNGMTIMRITNKLLDYIEPGNDGHKYIQGQLIRLVGIDEDSHVVSEIARELKEGAYFYGSDSE